jgi:hypothetical protein
MMKKILLSSFFIIGGFIIDIIEGYVETNLTLTGYNYMANLNVNNADFNTHFNVIIDTGSIDLTLYNISFPDNPNSTFYDKRTICLGLNVDQTIIQFQSQPPYYCAQYKSFININNLNMNIAISNITYTTLLAEENPLLHAWGKSGGDLGLAYASNYLTTFQKLIIANNPNSSRNNMIFGLDFNNLAKRTFYRTSNESTIQLGGIKSEFNNQINWVYFKKIL